MKNIDNLIRKLFPLYIIWLLGIYILMFVLCFYVHVKESNIIANRADALLGKLTLKDSSSWSKIASVQNMVRKTKPVFWELLKTDNSLFGKREFYGIVNRKLAKEIENNKNHLEGLILGQVHLEGANFAGADMHGANLEKANLSGADLSGANLIVAELGSVNLSHANLKSAKLLRANLKDAIFKATNLENVVGLTCKQIKSAVIDEKTRLPEYILMEASSDSEFQCRNLRDGKGLNLSKINLSNANLTIADLKKSDLSQTNFQNANLFYSQLNHANLSEANLNGANLGNAQLNEARIQGADLRGANLNRVIGITCEQIKSAVIDEKTRLPEYILMEASSDSEFQCRNLRDGKGLNLSKIDLSNAYLTLADLRKSDLSQANFQNTNLSWSQLQNANLRNANLNGAHLGNAQLNEARIQGADLRGANLNRVIGITCEQIKSAVINEKTRLPEYILMEASSDSEFQCRNLRDGKGLNLSKINLSNANITSAVLRESDLSQANFQNANLGWSQLQNANLRNANLKKANLFHSYLNNTNLSEANLNGAHLVNAELHEARMQGADLRGANLDRAIGLTCEQIKSAVINEKTRLPDYILMAASSDSEFQCRNLRDGKGLNLSKIDLSNAYLTLADLRKSDLSQANFQNANLGWSQLQNANLRNANLKKANLFYSQLNNANLSEANLNGAHLVNAHLHEARIQGADLRGANLNRAIGLTCEQVKSAVIDKKTRLPDYVSLTGSLESEYICVHSP